MVRIEVPPLAGPRSAFIDMARGLAICGMVAFHLRWDLNDWGWQESGPADSPFWTALGHAVAATFLFVSGYCLILARGRGMTHAMRRIGIVIGAAALITLVTRWLFPADFVFFGILHCIAASNLIGLAFLGAPVALTIAAACSALAMPHVAASTIFDAPVWWWLGLSTPSPATLDYRPLFPWLAAVLFGIAAARLGRPVPNIVPRSRWSRGLAWAGRQSLLIYVVHQPLLFAMFFLLATVDPPPAPVARSAFGRECLSQCVAAGAGNAGCQAACACVMRRTGMGALGEAPTEAELRGASETCVRGDAKTP